MDRQDYLIELAQKQLGNAIGFRQISIGEREIACLHPDPVEIMVSEMVKIIPIKSSQDNLVGFAGRCSCGILYYHLLE